ncbi:MAG: AsmA family protein [Planctomycetes bacterium]|nr:AsmA family protein [Planctomycetota bacterium]
MRKIRKTLSIIAVCILILLIGTIIMINLFSGQAVKLAIETAATKTLNVKVTLDDADLSILSGKLTLEDLQISNPAGYQHDKLLKLENGQISVNIGSLLDDEVIVKSIKLDGVDIVLEQRGVSGNNLQDIIKQIPAGEKTKSESKKLHINNLEITNIKVDVKLLPLPGKVDTLTLKLDDIKMQNLGSDNKLDMAKLSSKILLAITGGIAEKGAGKLPKEMLSTLSSELKRVKDLSQTLLKEGSKILDAQKDIGKEAINTGKDIEKAATETLKGLFKTKKEE